MYNIIYSLLKNIQFAQSVDKIHHICESIDKIKTMILFCLPRKQHSNRYESELFRHAYIVGSIH